MTGAESCSDWAEIFSVASFTCIYLQHIKFFALIILSLTVNNVLTILCFFYIVWFKNKFQNSVLGLSLMSQELTEFLIAQLSLILLGIYHDM
jgi:hypothetical protein